MYQEKFDELPFLCQLASSWTQYFAFEKSLTAWRKDVFTVIQNPSRLLYTVLYNPWPIPIDEFAHMFQTLNEPQGIHIKIVGSFARHADLRIETHRNDDGVISPWGGSFKDFELSRLSLAERAKV